MSAYYCENDPKAAATLRLLIAEGLIAHGDVDERSIEDVKPSELLGYTQCHFFAGAGIWSYAARRAGWPDSRPLWTGSCPCQPFSAAGKGCGFADERHLWPAFFHLIQHGKPEDVPILGEQVASKDGLTWLDLIQADLEGAGHTCWPYDLCAAGFGAPIIRQRLFWVAISSRVGLEAGSASSTRFEGGAALAEHRSCIKRVARTESGGFWPRLRDSEPAGIGRHFAADGCSAGGLDESSLPRLERHSGDGNGSDQPGRVEAEPSRSTTAAGSTGWLGSAESGGRGICGDETHAWMRGHIDGAVCATSGMAVSELQPRCTEHVEEPRRRDEREEDTSEPRSDGENCGPRPTNGFWRDVDWLYCRDDKWRPVEPGAFVLAHGYPQRTGLLRLAGNAINAEVATAFIEEVMETIA